MEVPRVPPTEAGGVAPVVSRQVLVKPQLDAVEQERRELGPEAWRGTTRLELVPRWAAVRTSSLPGAGLGLFAAQDLPSGFELGQYVGAIDRGTVFNSSGAYTWEITPQRPTVEGEMIWIDGERYGSGLEHDIPNNLRYVNCANKDTEINTEMFQRGEGVFYRTTQPVKQGQELLMTYGPFYWTGGQPSPEPEIELAVRPSCERSVSDSDVDGDGDTNEHCSDSEQSEGSETSTQWRAAMTQKQLLVAAASIRAAHDAARRSVAADRSSAADPRRRACQRGCSLTALRDFPCHALVLCETLAAPVSVTDARERFPVAHSCRPNLRAMVEPHEGPGGTYGSNTSSADPAVAADLCHYELRAARAIAKGDTLSADCRPRTSLLGRRGNQCGLRPCIHCDGVLNNQRGAQFGSCSTPPVDGTRALACPFCIPVTERVRGYVLPSPKHPGTSGEICPIIGPMGSRGPSCTDESSEERNNLECRWLCSRHGCPAARLADRDADCDADGVSQAAVDVPLGVNSIAPSYLSLEKACETMVQNMCARSSAGHSTDTSTEAETTFWTPIGMQPPHSRQHLAEDGSRAATETKRQRRGVRPVTFSTTAEIADGINRARAVERLIGHSHWTVAAAALLLLRTDCSHGHVEEHFDRRFERLWQWLISTERRGLLPTVAMDQLLGTSWVLGVADGLRAAVSTPAWLCNVDVSDQLLTALRPEHFQDMERDDLVVVEGPLLSKWELRGARLELEMLRQRGELSTVGQPSEVRRDEVCWLRSSVGNDDNGNESASSGSSEDDYEPDGISVSGRGRPQSRGGLSRAVSVLRGAAALLQEHQPTRALTVPRNCMVACYGPDGAHYVAHRDNQGNTPSDRRCFTLILYLNDPDWDAERDGGALRAYVGADLADEDGDSAKQVVDICPKGGTLVMFRSRVLLHEVLPARRRRWALSVWVEEDFPLEHSGENAPHSVLLHEAAAVDTPHRDEGDTSAAVEVAAVENSASFEGNAKKLSAAVKWYGRVLQCTPPHSVEWLVAARGIRAVARSLGKFSPRHVVPESDSGDVEGTGEPGLLLDEEVVAWLGQQALLGQDLSINTDGDAGKLSEVEARGGGGTAHSGLPECRVPCDSHSAGAGDGPGVETAEDDSVEEEQLRTQRSPVWSWVASTRLRVFLLVRPVRGALVTVSQHAMVFLTVVGGVTVEAVRNDTAFGAMMALLLLAIPLRRRIALLMRSFLSVR